jgi:hypothetical protein
MTRDKLISDMRKAQSKLVDDLWMKRPPDTILKSKEELVTLASIVEKETGKADERPQVAAVFVNRLKKGMRLQSDPTIIYGIAPGKGKLDRPLTRADIDAATAYNTYQIDGLPPGPIATPGRASLEAVLNPAPVNYIYFVADGTGGHAFATTLEEHNANVAKWRRIEDSQSAASATATATATVETQSPVAPPEVKPAEAATAEALPDAKQVQDTTLKDVTLEPAPVPSPIPAPAAAPDANGTKAETPVAETSIAQTPSPNDKPVEPAPALLAPETGTPEPAAAPAPQIQAAESEPAVVLSETPLNLKPGAIINIGGKLIPVPAPKPARKPKP